MEDDTNIRERRTSTSSSWLWVLMLPIFFVLGWVANDALTQSSNTGAQPGVGGGPPNERIENISPTEQSVPEDTQDATPELSPTITGEMSN